jgi:hypothetical protein
LDLWIANATRQTYQFNYRVVDPDQRYRSLNIEPGRQEKIPNLTHEDIKFVTENHAMYGLLPHEDIDRALGYHGTCFAVGKPVPADRLAYLMDHNQNALIMQGKEIRKLNALAASANIDRMLSDTPLESRVSALEVTMQQENADPRDEAAQVSEGIVVTNDPSRPPPAASGRRRAA